MNDKYIVLLFASVTLLIGVMLGIGIERNKLKSSPVIQKWATVTQPWARQDAQEFCDLCGEPNVLHRHSEGNWQDANTVYEVILK